MLDNPRIVSLNPVRLYWRRHDFTIQQYEALADALDALGEADGPAPLASVKAVRRAIHDWYVAHGIERNAFQEMMRGEETV